MTKHVISIVALGLFLLPFHSIDAAPERARGSVADEEPNLEGIWVLNYDLSDDPQEKMAGMREQGGRGGFGGGGRRPGGGGGGRGGGRGGGGFGGGRGSGGGQFDPNRMERMQAAMQLVMQASARFTITQREGEVVITDKDGVVHIMRTDGRTTKRMIGNGIQVERKTEWDDGRLVVETDVGSGSQVTQVYELSAEGTQLRVTSALENSRVGRNIEIRRVYEAAEDEHGSRLRAHGSTMVRMRGLLIS